MLKFQSAIFLPQSKILKLILVANTIHACTLVVSKNNSVMNSHFLVLRYSQHLYINVTKMAHIMLHHIKFSMFNITKVLTLLQAKHQPNLKIYMQLFLMEHPPSHHILKQLSVSDILSHRNHLFIVNSKNTNILENKICLVQYTQMYRLMQNSTIWLAEYS